MEEMILSEDKSEIVSYNFNNFKILAKKNWLSYYPNMAAASHWHNDLEFIIILQGKMLYSVNGTEYLLEKGQGIFINSRQLHYGYSIDKTDCEFLCLLYHPSLLYTIDYIKDSYVETICENTALTHLILKPLIPWQKELMRSNQKCYELCQIQSQGFELAVLSNFYSLWYTLYQNVSNTEVRKETVIDKRLESLHAMIGYIQNNYPHKITLAKIALAGCVCRSNCCDIFNRILGITPIEYLTNYRIEKSMEMLTSTPKSITDIALQCGFNSSSYFTEIFHKMLGSTPSEYKKKIDIERVINK